MAASSMVQPLEQLGDVLQRFIRTDGLRLLCIEVSPALRAGVVPLVLASEHLSDNRSPLLAVELPPCRDADAVWEEATDALRAVHEALRAQGSPLAPLAERPMRAQGSASFAAQLLQCVGTVRSPAEGVLFACLAAVGPVEPAWLRRFGETVANVRLKAAKFIVVFPPSSEVTPWVASIDRTMVMHHMCIEDEAQRIAELEAEVDAEEHLGAGRIGAWPPGVRPPARRWLKTPKSAGARHTDQQANIDARDAVDIDTRIRVHIKRAALASRRGDGPQTVAQQAAARDLCLADGRTAQAIELELVLGAYLVQFLQYALAVESFNRAAARATDVKLHDLAAQGHLAAAATHVHADEPVQALAACRHAIAVAAEGKHVDRVFEAYWEASRIALRLELEYDALALLGSAFVYAQDIEPAQLRGTRAKPVMDELVRLLARHRRYSEAREVERMAARL